MEYEQQRTCYWYSSALPLAEAAEPAHAPRSSSARRHYYRFLSQCSPQPASASVSHWLARHPEPNPVAIMYKQVSQQNTVWTAASASSPSTAERAALLGAPAHLKIVGAVWLALILEPTNRLVDICATIVIEFSVMIEDDNSHLTLA